MKAISFILALAWLGVNALLAQVDQSKADPAGATDGARRWEEMERDAHSRVWARVSYETNALGEAVASINSFVELQPGLHYREGDKWLASEAKMEILPDNAGAVAAKGQNKVIFPFEIKSRLVELALPATDLARRDTQWLRSRVWGLAYFGGATGKSVLLAEVKASEGQLVGDNTVL